MTDRETRLRQRIDQLTDERDTARVRAQRFASRLYSAKASRDMWRQRALTLWRLHNGHLSSNRRDMWRDMWKR